MVCGENKQILIIIVSIIIICLLVIHLIKNYNKIGSIVIFGLVLIIAGGLSNLIDRIARGHVVDYIDINQIFNYPIFNVADISIVVGVILLIFYIITKTIKKQENV